MIICILFFEMNLATALWTGLVVGIAYTMFARAMYRQQLALLQREMLREHQATLPQQRSPSGSSPRWLSTPALLHCTCLRSIESIGLTYFLLESQLAGLGACCRAVAHHIYSFCSMLMCLCQPMGTCGFLYSAAIFLQAVQQRLHS